MVTKLKGWKKTMHQGWSNYKKGIRLRVNNLGNQDVVYASSSKNEKPLFFRKFKTKPQALRYAKTYMRKNK